MQQYSLTDIIRRGALPEETSTLIAEMTAIKIGMRDTKKEDMRCVIYIDSVGSMLAIDKNRENHPILNQIYDILVHAHIEIKENEEADKAAKQSIEMPGMTTTRIPHADYNLTIRRARKSEWQRE